MDDRGKTVLKTCLCLSVRRASRAVAHIYDDALGAVELTNGQFTLLARIALTQPAAITALANILHIDRTTLTRNLCHLADRKAISEISKGDDRRQRKLALTAEGETILSTALPHWDLAQRQLEKRLGHAEWQATLRQLRVLLDGPRTPKRKRQSPTSSAQREPLHGIIGPHEIEYLKRHFCMCTLLRQCSRVLSRSYDESLRAYDQRISQFHVLAALQAFPGIRNSGLTEILTLDQTSISRMIQHQAGLGFIHYGEAAGKRGELFTTEKGRASFNNGWKAWKRVQTQLVHTISVSQVTPLEQSLSALRDVSTLYRDDHQAG